MKLRQILFGMSMAACGCGAHPALAQDAAWLIIDVSPEIASVGGTVITSARPVDQSEWLTHSDRSNFVADVNSTATFIEFPFPEDGTYRVTFLLDRQNTAELQTSLVQVGSRFSSQFSYSLEAQVFLIEGSDHDAADARGISARQWDLLAGEGETQDQDGVSIFRPDPTSVERTLTLTPSSRQ